MAKKPSCAIGASGRFMLCLPLPINRNRLQSKASYSSTGHPTFSRSEPSHVKRPGQKIEYRITLFATALEAASSRRSNTKRNPKTVLKLLDLEQSKSTVLNSLTSASSKHSYDHAISEFINWYCSEPRVAFNNRGYTVPDRTSTRLEISPMCRTVKHCHLLHRRDNPYMRRLVLQTCSSSTISSRERDQP